jgi:DNA-binding IclR family transcriptional regulator
MTEEQPVKLVKSDREQIIDLLTTAVGLVVLAYTTNPEPFQRAWDRVRAWGYAWHHRISVLEALQAIRSLPETDE